MAVQLMVEGFVFFVYLVFVLGVLCFGRCFSILQIGHIGNNIPIFITEVLLLITLPFIAIHFKKLLVLPKKFLIFLFIYYVLGFFYLLFGLLNNNLFALRDSVLFIYILFFPLTFLVLKNKKRLFLFLLILGLGNLVGLLVGRFMLLDLKIADTLMLNVKTFNYGLYYGMFTAYLIVFWDRIQFKIGKLAILIFISLNLYLTVMFSVRTIWVAAFVLVLYFIFIMPKKTVRLTGVLLPVFLVVAGTLFYLDFIIVKDYQAADGIIKRAESAIFFVQESRDSLFREVGLASDDNSAMSLALKKDEDFRTGFGNMVWRRNIWGQSIEFGLENPIFGKGFGVYPSYKIWGQRKTPERIGVDSNVVPVHNHLITIFYKMGFIGLALFLFINTYVFVYGLKYISKCQDEFLKCFLIGTLGAFVFWHVTALAFDVIDSPPTSIFLWIIMGLIFASIQIDKHCQIQDNGHLGNRNKDVLK